MLDVHPLHSPTHTWRDFFIHIATITVGLLIAVGIEQVVEATHHHHQSEQLIEEMRSEAEANIPTIAATQQLLEVEIHYAVALENALSHARAEGELMEVAPVMVPKIGNLIIVSPSRGTWVAAQTSGLASLLPAEEAKIYSRLEYSADEQFRAEDVLVERYALFQSETARAHYGWSERQSSRITSVHCDDLLFRINQLKQAILNFAFRLAIMQGADEAIAAGVTSIPAMVPYQRTAVDRAHLQGATNRFFSQPKQAANGDDPSLTEKVYSVGGGASR